MTVPRVLGIDPSLTRTGLAGLGWTDTITTAPRRAAQRDRANKTRDNQLRTAYNHERLTHIRARIDDYLTGIDLAVIEGLAYGAKDTDRQLAGLSWIVRHQLWTRRVPYAVVPPMTLKQFVTGTGAADKDLVREYVADWFTWFDGDDNEADAAGLMAMGYAHLGAPMGPLMDHQVTALAKSAWPGSFAEPLPPVALYGDERYLAAPCTTAITTDLL